MLSQRPPKDTANKKTFALMTAVIKAIRRSYPDNYRITIRRLRAVKTHIYCQPTVNLRREKNSRW